MLEIDIIQLTPHDQTRGGGQGRGGPFPFNITKRYQLACDQGFQYNFEEQVFEIIIYMWRNRGIVRRH